MASGSLTRQRSMSNRQETPQIVLPKGKETAEAPFIPTAATASHFLFAQSSTVVVLHHDTLALERRFQSHTDNIEIISVDNVSERNSGRLVVTYDVGKTAIIWDLFTGQQVSRFASFEPLLVAAWMRNGNIAFGNEKGDVILFEPSTSEHISARTIHDPITALAPSSDCKTYALGYRNGSILLAALQPQFTILHTLNTTRSPSPISMLTWHASSSKQKSDMLAIQNADGDLRVWSVPKPPTNGIPRVIRILKRSETAISGGRNWVSWSKNGRIIQFSEGGTWAWDVRTKDVNYVPIPTVEFVDGIAAHGPTASLFTLGMDSTVQQYDVESGNMVANIRHLPLSIPPTPPEEHVRQFNSVSQQEARSPLRTSRNDNESNDSPISQSQAAGLRKLEKTTSVNDITSPVKTERSATTFSMGTYNYGQTQPRALQQQQQPISPVTGPSRDRVRQASRLRQEVLMSPMPSAAAAAAAEEAPQLIDLFPFARLRLSDTLSSSLKAPDENNSTPDDLRKHMLNVVFGWEDDIYALIADELQRHPDDSLNALYLTKWLHHGSEAFAELLANTTPDTSLDTLRLALGVIDSRPENKKLGQIFVEKALGNGDIHTAVAVLIAMGDKNDAIEVYVTNNCYLESILLTCLMMPGDWQRQSHLVRRWGEHVVENSQQQLAIRCFACTGVEPADDWTSPTARLFNKFASPISATMSQPAVMFPRAPPAADYEQYQQSPAYSAPPAIQNPSVSRLKGRGFDSMTPVALVAPPSPFRQAAASGTRITPQTGGLKLITSFGPTTKSFKFPGLKTPDMTPTNTNTTMVTPIAESATTRSALSPGGLGSYRMNNIQSLNNAMAMSYPMSAGPGRQRLPSIGETPQDVDTPRFPQSRGIARAPPTPADSGSDREKERVAAARAADTAQQSQRSERSEPALTLLTSARYDPSSTPIPKYESDPEPQTALRPRDDNNSWHASANQGQEEFNPTETYDIPSRPGTTDTTGTQFVMSTPDPNDSWRVKSPSVSARSVDQYISSLEQAQYYGRTHSSNSNRPRKEERSDRNKSRSRKHKNSEVTGPKRSPSSPVPMSPDDLRHFTTSVESFDSMLYSSANTSATDQPGFSSSYDQRGSNAEMGRTRHRSRSTHTGMRRKHSLKGSRRSSPGPEADVSRRGRSQSRKAGSVARSPSSPMPMLPSDEDMERVGSVDPAFRFVSQNRSRLQRSTSRRPERGTSARRDASPDRRRGRQRSPSRQRDAETPVASKINGFGSNDSRHRKRDASEDPHRRERSQYESLEQLDQMAEMIRKNDVSGQRMTSKSKELAQAELEARRLSLARNPSAPPIPFPSSHSKSASDGIYPPHAAMQRNHSDLAIRTLPRGSSRLGYEDPQERPATSQGMQDHEESARPSHQSQKESLSNLSYQLLPARTYSANKNPNQTDSWTPEDPPSHMPRHPGFDHRIGTSRRSSRSRTRAASQDGRRGVSTERSKQFVESKVVPEEESLTEEPPAVIIGSPEFPYEGSESRESTGPTIIPELQHLAVPPPPPPPPPPPHPEPTTSFNQGGPLRIETDLAQGIDTPLPRSVYPGASDLPTGSEKQHRRQSSRDGSSQGQFLGKIRGITDRIRSSSRPRDNYTRSPNFDDYPTSPYETAHTMPTLLSVAGGGERR